MKFFVISLSLCFVLVAQTQTQLSTVSSDLSNAAQSLSAAQTALASITPAPTADPTVAMNQAAGLYAAMALCARTQGCVPVAFQYTCPGPAAWTPATTYQFGQTVSDPNGNIYALSQVVNTPGVSGATNPFPTSGTPPASVADGSSYAWTLQQLSTVPLTCSAQGTQALTVAH